jgi:4'-phosphopantetheinyl transferase EntD
MSIQMRRLTMMEMAARSLVPMGVAVAVTGSKGEQEPLWPAEITAITSAVPARAQEFAAGRTAARRALMALGRPPAAIPMGDDRAPVWPRAVVGSISHNDRSCIAIVGERDRYRGLGVDIESAAPLEAELFSEICRPEELAWLRQLPFASRGKAARRMFSAKEAIYKAQFAITHEMFGFDALSVVFDRQGRFQARLMKDAGALPRGTDFEGMTALVGDQILSFCCISEHASVDAYYPNSVTG